MRRGFNPGRAEAKIRARIAELRKVDASYRHYMKYRVSENDLHGQWDLAINRSEVSCEIDGLEFALKAMREERE